MARVGVSAKYTKNLGNYQSLSYEVEIRDVEDSNGPEHVREQIQTALGAIAQVSDAVETLLYEKMTAKVNV